MFERRRLLAAPQEDNGIIKDGLIFHLDGMDKGPNAGYWTDKINNIKMQIFNCNILPDCLEFKGDTSSYCEGPGKMPIKFDSTKGTLEVVYLINPNAGTRYSMSVVWPPKQGVNPALFSLTDFMNSVCYRSVGGKIFYTNGGTLGKKSVISMTDTFSIYNKADNPKKGSWAITTDSQERFLLGQAIVRGNFEGSYQGKIFDVRFYNRKLTKEEILHNQQCDIDKYFGGAL